MPLNPNSDGIKELLDYAASNGIKCLTMEPLSRHTTFKVGGPCSLMLFPDTIAKLRKILSWQGLGEIRHMVLGNGSNVLFSDQGYNGAIISLAGSLNSVKESDGVIKAEAGALLSRVARLALERGLTGMEPLSGIPGSIGGACYMNAGAYGGEMKDIVTSVTVLNRNGELKAIPREELMFGHRTSRFIGSGDIIAECTIKLSKAKKSDIQSAMEDFSNRRRLKQPLEYPSAGSVFKRPKDDFAGRLIEQCGLKGVSIGGAMVSQKHAGFIINKSGATSQDIKDLIDMIRTTVFNETGVLLECEVQIID